MDGRDEIEEGQHGSFLEAGVGLEGLNVHRYTSTKELLFFLDLYLGRVLDIG